jgi:hypothetical protein
MGDQLDPKLLPTQSSTNTEQTHDSIASAGEDISCLRPRGNIKNFALH